MPLKVISLIILFAALSIKLIAQVPGCTNADACNYNPAATQDDGSCTLPLWYVPSTIDGIFPAVLTCDGAPAGYILAEQNCAQTVIGADPYCFNTDWDNICLSAYNICAYGCSSPVDCLDPAACNYNPAGTCSFDNCTYPGCTDPIAYNYNPAAGCDNETCNYFNACGNPIFYGNGQGIDFVGYMHPDNWSTSNNGGNGSISFSSSSLTIVGNNNGSPSLFSEASVVAPVGGTVSFNWNWSTSDLPQFDPAFVEINGVLTQLTNNAGASSQGGFFTAPIAAGNTLRIYVNATDGCCGFATLTITGFQWPAACINGCTDPLACNFDPLANVLTECFYPGCTNPSACNFNALAGCEDNSCVFGACTNPAACNYDANAICDDGSCIVPPVNDSCENAIPLLNNGNYTYSNLNTCDDTPAACTPFGDEFPITMSNDIWFSFNATGGEVIINVSIIGSPTAAFPILYSSCAGEVIMCPQLNFSEVCLCTTSSSIVIPCGMLVQGQTYFIQIGGDVAFPLNNAPEPRTGNISFLFNQDSTPVSIGCNNPFACNFDPSASCGTPVVCTFPGCTDPNACNYNPIAGCDDGSCLTLDCFGECGGLGVLDGCGNCSDGFIEEKVFFYRGDAYEFEVPENVFNIIAELYGAGGGSFQFGAIETIGGRGGFAQGRIQVNPGDILYINTGGKGGSVFGGYNGGGNGHLSNFPQEQGAGGGGATDIRTSEFDLNSRILVAGGGGGASGSSQSPIDITDLYIGGAGGDEIGTNGIPSIVYNTGSNQLEAGEGGGFGFGGDATPPVASGGGGGGWYGGGSNPEYRTSGGGGSGYAAPSVIDPILSKSDNLGDGYVVLKLYTIAECIPGCNDSNASNYNPLATYYDFSCEYLGCTNPLAINYNAFAFIDDGSCILPGCTYPDAENFNALANSDDGTCIFPPTGDTCPADVTGDGVINTNDLLALLAAFGSICP